MKNEKSINKVAKPFSMCHINIRNTAKNLSSFSDYLSNFDHDFTFIGISESWLNENNKELYHLNGYNTVSKRRLSKTGGGVSLYINEKIPFIERHDLNLFNEYIKSVFIEIDKSKLNVEKNVIIGVIYRPPNTDIEIFNEYLGGILDKVGHEKKTVIYHGWL